MAIDATPELLLRVAEVEPGRKLITLHQLVQSRPYPVLQLPGVFSSSYPVCKDVAGVDADGESSSGPQTRQEIVT